LQVKNSTAFAKRRQIQLQKTVDSEVMVWWRDWYEDGVNEPWDGAHQRVDEVAVGEK
jgi:hypothetical protein